MKTELLLYIIIILLITALIFLKYKKNNLYEKFTSSISLYTDQNSVDFDKKMSQYSDTMTDRDDLLQMYGCGINIGESPRALDQLTNDSTPNLYKVPFEIITNNFSDITGKIFKIIENFYERINRIPIKGQIFVIISQAPFYRDATNKPITLQYNIDEYRYESSNPTVLSSGSPLIQIQGYVVFASYDTSGEFINNITVRNNAIQLLKKYFRQKEKLCYVKCPNHNEKPCGCSSRQTPYASTCVESSKTSKMTPGEKYTYAILYRINARYSDLMNMNMLEFNYNDLAESPKISDIYPIPLINKR